MKPLNSLRYYAWRATQITSDDSIWAREQNIKSIMTDDAVYEQWLPKKIEELLSYAVRHTSFYSEFAGNEISQFPVIDKNIIMANQAAFQSDEYMYENLHVMSTSGSTGRPFAINQDQGKRRQVLAEVLYFSGLLGYRVGDKLVYLRNLESALKKSKLKQFIQNENVICTQKYDDSTLNDIVKQLVHFEKHTTVLGYASTLHALATYMERSNIVATNISGIISGAEAITSKTRRLVEKQFRCPVVSRYSNQEMGILAQDTKEDVFLLNRASYYFEILNKENDMPAEFGEVGRIVVTDLFNHATPLIRYDTGDLGIMRQDSQGRAYLAKVLGRKLDLLYNTKDEPLSFFALDEYFEPNLNIEQYQIVQEDRTHLTVNVIMKPGTSLNEEWCISGVKSVMGQDCNVRIQYKNSVPITASGKFRYVISNYHPE